MMKEKIIAIRGVLPIGIMEAKELLKECEGDVNLAKERFIERQIGKIVEQTGENAEEVKNLFSDSQYDINLCISAITKSQYDKAFDTSRLEGLTDESFKAFDNWLQIEEDKSIHSALAGDIEEVLKVIEVNLLLPELSKNLREANLMMNQLIEEVKEKTVEEIVQSINELKSNKDYLSLTDKFEYYRIRLNDELEGVKRNYQK